jgi:hypothetical protein
MPFLLVTVGTDVGTNWVRLPDGQKFNLGSMSVLSFVTKLAKNAVAARKALDGFLKKGEALLSVDSDKMWPLMQPRRAIWAAGSGSLYSPGFVSRPTSARFSSMSILEGISKVEHKMAYLDRLASAGKKDPEAIAELMRLAGGLKSPQQGGDLGFVAEAQSKLAFDVYSSNLGLAEGILVQAKEVLATIEGKLAEGRSSKAAAALARAKADVHAVTVKTGSICEKTQLTEDWVRSDIQKLSAKMTKIHELFHPQA